MTSAIHKAQLSWVRPPITNAIGRAQVALDSYFEKIKAVRKPPGGVQQTWIENQRKDAESKLAIITHEVDLIHSAMVIVGSAGGRALTTEMNIICQSISENQIAEDGRERALMALMTALVTLPNYMNLVIDGAPDSPSIVSKPINEIREVRNVPLLVEENLMPDLAFSFIDPPKKDQSAEPEHRTAAYSKAGRPFQTAFTSWLSTKSKTALQDMKSILSDLQVVSHSQEVGCFWWAAEALLDLLLQGGLRHNNNTVTQLRAVSVAIQKASTEGEPAALQTLGTERFRNLLYAISMSTAHTDESSTIMVRFNVISGVDSDNLKALQERLSKSSATANETVALEVETLLSQAMVALGRAVTVKNEEAFKHQINSFLGSIREVANVFYMVNDDELAAVARTAAGRITSSVTPLELKGDALESLKSDLLYLDARVRNMSENTATRVLGIEGVETDVIESIVSETLKVLVEVRRSIALHVDSGEAKERLRAGLEELLAVSAVTSFSGATKVGAVLKGVSSSLISMLDKGGITESAEYENAARGLVSVEIYLESIHSGFDPDPQILEHGIEALALNGVDVEVVALPSKSTLIYLFENANQITQSEEDPLLHEMAEVRSVFEKYAVRPQFDDLPVLSELHQASDRISMASKIHQIDALFRLGSAFAKFAKEIYSHVRTEEFDLQAASVLAKDASLLMLRCFDEYAARGTINIFIADTVKSLHKVIGSNPDNKENDGATPGLDQQATCLNGEDKKTTEADDMDERQALEETKLIDQGEVLLASELDDERDYPDGVDPFLMDLYRKEYKANHDDIISRMTNGPLVLNEHLCRAVHTLRGCSGSAQCDPLNRVFAALENRLRDLAVNDPVVTQPMAEAIIELLGECLEFHNAFPWQITTQLEGVWIDMAANIGLEDDVVEFVEVPVVIKGEEVNVGHHREPEKPEEEESCSLINEPANEDHPAQVITDQAPVSLPTVELHDDQDVEPVISQVVIEADYDKELAPFYLEEADERLPQLQDNFAAWLSDLGNRELINTIKRQMHTLKGAAAMASLGSIQDVTHQMESLFESLSLNIIPADQNCIDLVAIVLQELGNLTTAVRAHRGLTRPVGLLHCLTVAVEHNRVDLELLNHPGGVGVASAEPLAVDNIQPPEEPANTQQPETHRVNTDSPETNDTGSSSVEDSVEDQDGESTSGEGPRKTRRRSRGKGSAKRHAERMAAIAAGEVPADAVSAAGITSPLAEMAPEPEEIIQPVSSRADGPVIVTSEESVAPTVSEQAEAAAPVERKQSPAQIIDEANTTPSPESPDANTPSTVAEAIGRVTRERRTPFDDGKETIIQPVVSSAVRELLDRTQITNGQSYAAQRTGSTEKIKVDQRLLETAVVQSSELTASRHRQLALQKDLSIGLTTIREKMQGQVLHQSQIIHMLRAHLNQPQGMRSQANLEELQLERFNDISSMAVHSASYIAQIVQDLDDVISQGEVMQDSFRNQGRLISSLQRDLIHSRLVPFHNIKPALTSTINNTAILVKKKVKAEFTGGDTILDKKILDAIKDPMFHLLRNAIDHGLETEQERLAAGKPAEGTLKIGVARRAKYMVITIADDGRGIDPDAVRAKAISNGLIRETDELTEREIIRLITHNGFSTSKIIGNISGRGVGMDIVVFAVESMGGVLQIDSKLGAGTTFTLELPFSIGSNRAMICKTGGQWFAIPTFTMSQVAHCPRSALEQQVNELGYAVFEHEGEQYSVVALADLIAMPELKSTTGLSKTATLLLCRHGSTRVAIEVERADSMPEIHIRELEGILRNVRGLIGETELSDGSAIFVLDVMELIRLNLKQAGDAYTVRQNRVRSVKREHRPLAFVVDDATSYRRLLTQYFDSRGFEVITARDGQDAVDMLPLERVPDIITVDVEMPRLDGFGLTKRLRAMGELDQVPIIMLTTRTGLDEQAAAVGANVYLHKPCDYAALDAAVRSVRADLITSETAA